jgi:hypothetical protein
MRADPLRIQAAYAQMGQSPPGPNTQISFKSHPKGHILAISKHETLVRAA